jgi:two-component system, OmpR family, alkaline phosphatase synthesis response regulator PhoP
LATVLALDKDPLQVELLGVLLKSDRHVPLTTSDPERAFAMLESEIVDMVILEIVLPRHDGFRLCQQIRQARADIPIIIVSERGGDEQIVRGLLAGADDYVTKPYSPRELLARIQAVMRRSDLVSRNQTSLGSLRVGELALNVHQMYLSVNGAHVELTPREFSVLHVLMTNANRVLSRDQLMRLAWGAQFDGLPKTVDVCIQRLRQKLLPRLVHGDYIQSVRGFGYRLEKPKTEPLAVARSAFQTMAVVANRDTAG